MLAAIFALHETAALQGRAAVLHGKRRTPGRVGAVPGFNYFELIPYM